MHRAASLALVALVVASTVVGSAGTVAASTSTGPPSGMVGVPEENIGQATSPSASFPYRADNLTGDVLASSHAASTEVLLASPFDAEQMLDGNATVAGAGNLALVIRDDSAHDGRTIAIRASEVRDALGYLPSHVAGVHDDGSQWTERVTVESGFIVVEIPHFSSNAITFTGEVELSGDPATSGTSYRYGLESTDSVDNLTIDVTGRETSTWANESATGVATGSTPVSFGGNLALTGPSANNKPTMELTAHKVQQGYGSHDDYGSVIDESWESEVGVVDGKIEKLTVGIYDTNDPSTFDIRIVKGEGADGNYGEGTLVNSSVTVSGGGTHTVHFDQPIAVDSQLVTVEFVQAGTVSLYPWVNTGLSENRYSSGGSVSQQAGQVQVYGTPDSVTANADDGTSVSFGGFADGETKTKEFQISKSASSVDLSADGGRFDWKIAAKENRQTDSPSVEVNGHWTNYSGLMTDGETVSLSTNESWVRNGTNRVNISLAGGAVGFDYSHQSRDDQTVSYTGEVWSERYNVSRTYGDAGQNATLEIPFEGNVVSNRVLRLWINGTETAPTWSRYRENSTTLMVGLGDLDAGTTARVEAVGSKVRVVNGSIDVLDPTLTGNTLDSEIRLTDWAADSYIDVSETSTADRVHHFDSASWSSSEAFSSVYADGRTHLHAPNAADGATARVQTMPLALDLDSGAIEIRVSKPSTPRFTLRAGDTSGTDRVEMTFFDVLDGERYALLEQPDDDEVRATEASGGSVSFATDGDTATYSIEQRDSSGGGSSDVAIGVGASGDGNGSSPFSILAVFAGMAGSIVGALLIGRQFFGVTGFRANGVVVLVGAVAGLVGIEMATSESVVGGLVGAVLATDAGVVVITLGLLLALWALHSWLSLPLWVRVAAGIAVAIWAIDALSDGALTGTLDRLGPLLWLVLLGGGVLLLWQALRGPTFIIGGRKR